MASITSLGVGSGLDVETIVTQLVAAERAATDLRHNSVQKTTNARVSAFGAISSALSSLRDTLDTFKGLGANLGRTATVASGAGFTATSAPSAATGQFMVSVERIATAHKLQSASLGADTQLGHGRLSIAVGADDPIVVDIAAGDGTLAGIRDAINAKAGGAGVTAAVIRGDTGDVLVLSSTKTGADGAITVTQTGGDGGLAALATTGGTMTTITAADDAQVTVDGVVRTSSSNTLADVIDGVTLNLTKAVPGESFALDIGTDPAPLKEKLKEFVAAYNKVLSVLATQSAAGGTGSIAGPLSGDSMARSLTSTLRNTISEGYAEVAALGLKTAVDGSLSLDEGLFDAAILKSPDAVKTLLGPEVAIGKGLKDAFATYLGTGGLLAGRSDALKDRLESLADQRDAFDVRMAAVEANYRRQFTALDSMMAQLQTTSSFITQITNNFNNSKK